VSVVFLHEGHKNDGFLAESFERKTPVVQPEWQLPVPTCSANWECIMPAMMAARISFRQWSAMSALARWMERQDA